MKRFLLAILAVPLLVFTLGCPASTSATFQTAEYKTVGAAVDGANLALSLYETEFEQHLTTPAQDQAVTDLHRKFQGAVKAVADANVAYNAALAAVASGKATIVDPNLSAKIAAATSSAIQAGVDMVTFINSLKKK